jgi:hypothetical protein
LKRKFLKNNYAIFVCVNRKTEFFPVCMLTVKIVLKTGLLKKTPAPCVEKLEGLLKAMD